MNASSRTFRHAPLLYETGGLLAVLMLAASGPCSSQSDNCPVDAGVTADGGDAGNPAQAAFLATAEAMLLEGQQTFRYSTFGDEAFWGDTLHLHQAIAGTANGGVGAGVSPTTALAVGLKVDSDALPSTLVSSLKAGTVNLSDPATTLALLQLNAVVGVTGIFDSSGKITSMGIQCALCHSTVDDSLAPGIGKRLDGWPNRDLNVGAIVALAPDLSAPASLLGVSTSTLKTVLNGWGPGKFDAEVFLDGKAVTPDGGVAATLIPPAFGLAGVNLHTWTGWGSVTYWNAFVAILEMHGKGTLFDPRLNAGADGGTPQFPVAVAAGFANVRDNPDLVTPRLANLHLYQLAIPAPSAPAGSFDSAAATRGQVVFNGAGKCATCHVPPLYTEPGWNMHTAEEIGIDDFQSKRSPDNHYRTSPLKGLFAHTKGGFYHDGRFATLAEVVTHYDMTFALGLTSGQQADLVEFLKSL
jgi:hypothetical protein